MVAERDATNNQKGLSPMNRNYKLRLSYADGSTAKVILATYSLLVSVLVGMKTRSEAPFTYSVSIFGNEMDQTDYAQLDNAVNAWLDVYRAKAAMAVLDEARERANAPYLYCNPLSAEEAEAMAF
jgi:hypothetical protein